MMIDLQALINKLDYKKRPYQIINMSADELETDLKATNNLNAYTLWYWKPFYKNGNVLEIKVIPKREY